MTATLFRVSGRKPRRDGDGHVIVARHIVIDDVVAETGRELIHRFKQQGGTDPDRFAAWVNAETPYTATVLDGPVISHTLEHDDPVN